MSKFFSPLFFLMKVLKIVRKMDGESSSVLIFSKNKRTLILNPEINRIVINQSMTNTDRGNPIKPDLYNIIAMRIRDPHDAALMMFSRSTMLVKRHMPRYRLKK